MFESLSTRLQDVFSRLTRRGALSEADVDAALREVRVALLEADVALTVVKDLIAAVRQEAVGGAILRSVTPGQMVIKLVHDRLVKALGEKNETLDLAAVPPAIVLMVGLQGSGKTTTTAKLARRLAGDRKKTLMASLDIRRPAAQEQLAVLGRQTDVATLDIVPGEDPIAITRRALDTGRREGYDVVFLDTAGRLHIDDELMAELESVRDLARPVETLLVADAMTGQDAVNLARSFDERIGITGIVLTRTDGDARGGAALSMRAATGRPIKFVGTGEKLDAIEAFHPDRVAGRILGQGDVVSLVEKAAQSMDRAEAEKLAKKVEAGRFDLEDLLAQLRQLGKMGGIESMLSMLPGLGNMRKRIEGKIDPKTIRRQEAIILSMTPAERRRPEIVKASRKERIAAGSGTSVPEINRLLKQYQQMSQMMKRVGKLGAKGLMRGGMQNFLPPDMR